ncbi:neuropeptide Y receptor type 5-like [Aplysia californica]|uniref:Neuropeptide Y receptor type 5-like n=1 Tax=Aplysia californica TaxID=6500 RepID=A0ABM1W0Z8_APLCA|nr:neuropeptide Y receptor type 5-like [Aplysia californica]
MASLMLLEPNVYAKNLTMTSSTPLEFLGNASDGTDVITSLQTTRFIVQTVLTPIIVVVGLLGNVLNILVLLQPNMRSSTNVYIMVLSLADSVYLAVNLALSFLACAKRGLPDFAYYFNPYGRFASNFSGNVAVWVCVIFTVERYVAVCHPIHGKIWCTVRRARFASLAVSALSLVNTLPTIFELEVVESSDGLRCRYTQFSQSDSYELGYTWWYVTLFTFIPLISLTIFNTVLIRALLLANRKREQLTLISIHSSSSSTSNGKGCYGNKKTTVQTYGHASLRNQISESSEVTSSGVRSSSTSSGRGASRVTLPTTPLLQNKTTSSSLPPPQLQQQQNHHQPHNQQLQQPQNQQEQSRTSGLLPATAASPSSSCSSSQKRQSRKLAREQNKVTLLLVTIVMIFLLCQLPWTALFLYKTYLSSYNLPSSSTELKIAGNICNLLGLLNASVNFYLYSCFSRRFRRTLAKLVFCCRRWNNSPTTTV